MAVSVNPFDESTPAYFYYESLPDDKKSTLNYQVKRYGYQNTVRNLFDTPEFISFEKNIYKTSVQDPSNPYQFGTDAYKFYQSLNEGQKESFNENPYITSPGVLGATISAAGGLEKATAISNDIIGNLPSSAPNAGTYEAWKLAHPDQPATLGDFLSIALTPFLPGISSVIGSTLAPAASAAIQNAISQAVIRGTLAEVSGGDFLQGAAAGAIGAGAGSFVTPAISEALGGGQFGNIAAGALTGGGVSELLGGDFTTGALKGGVSAGISDYQQQLRQEQFDTAMTESGLAGQTSVEDFQPPALETAAPTIQDVISQITVPTQEQAQPSINQLITQLAPYNISSDVASSSFVGPRQQFQQSITDSQFVGPGQQTSIPLEFQVAPPSIDELLAELESPQIISPPVADQTVLTQEQLQPSIDELIDELAPYEEIPEITITAPREQTVSTQEEMQPVIDDLIAELDPYEVPSTQEIVITAPREQTVLTQEEMQSSINELLTELAPYEFPEVQEIVITAPREQTVLTQEQMQPAIDELLSELAPYEVILEAIDTSTGLQTVPTQKEAQLSVDELLTELAPYVQTEPVDNSKLISTLDVLKVISPAVITAILADNATQTTTQTPEQTGFPILPIPSDWRSPTYNQAFTPSAPIDFGTPALLAGTQWQNPPQFQQGQPYNLSNLINTLNYQSVPFVQQQYQMPEQTLNVNDVVSQYRTTPTVGTRDIIGNLGGKPVSIADIISGIQSQYG